MDLERYRERHRENYWKYIVKGDGLWLNIKSSKRNGRV